jgi:hypothetical protein
MKKFIVVIIAVVALFSSFSAAASEYIIVKEGDRVVIYSLHLSGSNNYYISTNNLVNPTVSQLSGTGLPSHLWGLINGKDGIYDTRLMKAGQDLSEMKANYENEAEYSSSLEESNDWHGLYHVISVLVILVALVIIIAKQQQIYKLKKK